MKPLFKLMLILASIFALTFIVIKLSGLFTVEDIKRGLIQAKTVNQGLLFTAVIILLIIDLFIAVPTLTVIVLSGYFLGFGLGSTAAILGLSIAGMLGYFLSFQLGDKLLKFLIREQDEINALNTTFRHHSPVFILLSRALPILPEVCACLSGITKLPFIKFIILWHISIVPYTLLACYAGSISTIDNPKPAIFTMIGLSLVFWLLWLFFKPKSQLNKSKMA